MAKHLTKKQREELSSRHAGTKSRRNVGTRELFYSFLIVSEGTKTEPEYFRHFTSRRSRVQVVGADRSTKKLLEEALRIRDLCTFDYNWLVFDKDDNEDFNEAIQLAEKAGHCDFLSLPCHSLFLPILALFGNAKVADLIHVAKPSRLKNANSDIF